MKTSSTKKISQKKASKKASAKLCSQSRCRGEAHTEGYCRLHYLANWKHIQLNKQLKAEARLNYFVDKLTKKYPDSYIEKIKEGVENEERFLAIAKELEVEAQDPPKETDSEFLERFLRVVKPGS